METASLPTDVLERIQSEREYHDDYYDELEVPLDVDLDLATETPRRPHNLTWAYYDEIVDRLGGDITGKKILVVGCGTGLVAMNLAAQGAKVHAFDLSEKAIDICRRRAEHNGLIDNIEFSISSCEELEVTPGSYDAVVGEMILHHIDIGFAMKKAHEALREGGAGVFMEWKQYAIVDAVRNLPGLRTLFPPGGYNNYATEHERKLNNEDLNICRRVFPNLSTSARYCIRGKLDYFFSPNFTSKFEKFDYSVLKMFPFLSPFSDGLVISFSKTE